MMINETILWEEAKEVESWFDNLSEEAIQAMEDDVEWQDSWETLLLEDPKAIDAYVSA
jgi:hypothetical protein